MIANLKQDGFTSTCNRESWVKKSIVSLILSLAKPVKDRQKLFIFQLSGNVMIVYEYGKSRKYIILVGITV